MIDCAEVTAGFFIEHSIVLYMDDILIDHGCVIQPRAEVSRRFVRGESLFDILEKFTEDNKENAAGASRGTSRYASCKYCFMHL